ncbi:MAG: peroxiredoxin-like family protein [Chloroflexota bacterium]|nr:peroxiredoxin-like family protein [Chloroflexota bacterium]
MTSAVSTPVRLAAGDIAPDFLTVDIFDRPIQFHNAVAHQPILLAFLRNGACALCNLRVSQLIARYPAYRARGIEVIAVFESPVESIRQYVGRQDAPFPIIADPTADLYALYGVEVSEEKVNATLTDAATPARVQAAAAAGFVLTQEEGSNFHRIPADFLIERGGRIHAAFYAERVGEHLSFEDIDAWTERGRE